MFITAFTKARIRGKCSWFATRSGITVAGCQHLAQTPSWRTHLLSVVRDCLFDIFATTLHIWGRSCIRSLRTRHAVVTGTHLMRQCLVIRNVNRFWRLIENIRRENTKREAVIYLEILFLRKRTFLKVYLIQIYYKILPDTLCLYNINACLSIVVLLLRRTCDSLLPILQSFDWLAAFQFLEAVLVIAV
jgi:hypothetical protein